MSVESKALFIICHLFIKSNRTEMLTLLFQIICGQTLLKMTCEYLEKVFIPFCYFFMDCRLSGMNNKTFVSKVAI
jgi:hypothetical protein